MTPFFYEFKNKPYKDGNSTTKEGNSMNVKYHSVKDIASITGKSVSWVNTQVRQGKLPVTKVDGRNVANKGTLNKFLKTLDR